MRRYEILRGGLLNDGRVARDGTIVLRDQTHRWPHAVSEALGALANRGFNMCPQEVRRLSQNAVALTYMPGEALTNPVPDWAASIDKLKEVTHLFKAFSLAGSELGAALTHADWLTTPLCESQTLIHGDPHPTNFVFDSTQRPCALIDFELATLGSHDANLLSLIFSWAPLEPIGLSCWRTANNLSTGERVAAILEVWQSASSSATLLDTGKKFIDWRKEWIGQLANSGNNMAQSLLADTHWSMRYEHAEDLLATLL